MPRITSLLFAGVVCSIVTMMGTVVNRERQRDDPHTNRDTVAHFAPSGHTRTSTDNSRSLDRDDWRTATIAGAHEVSIHKPDGPPRIELTGMDPQGRIGQVACSTCHAARKPNFENRTTATLDEFHQGMTWDHGRIACYACHHPGDMDSLRLADGTPVQYADVMTLCSQCHNKQAESFAHGAHGGMQGHWDLNRGPQMKNNCTDCHDPHLPSYPKMIVGFKPRDRFNGPSTNDAPHLGTHTHAPH